VRRLTQHRNHGDRIAAQTGLLPAKREAPGLGLSRLQPCARAVVGAEHGQLTVGGEEDWRRGREGAQSALAHRLAARTREAVRARVSPRRATPRDGLAGKFGLARIGLDAVQVRGALAVAVAGLPLAKEPAVGPVKLAGLVAPGARRVWAPLQAKPRRAGQQHHAQPSKDGSLHASGVPGLAAPASVSLVPASSEGSALA
jgi:hypothetical protein